MTARGPKPDRKTSREFSGPIQLKRLPAVKTITWFATIGAKIEAEAFLVLRSSTKKTCEAIAIDKAASTGWVISFYPIWPEQEDAGVISLWAPIPELLSIGDSGKLTPDQATDHL